MSYLRVLLLSAAVTALPLLGQQPEPTPYLAIHLVVDCASADKMFVKTRDQEQYCIQPAPLVTDRDVSSAQATSYDRPSLNLTFGAGGSERLYKITADVESKRTVAVLINGDVVGVAQIVEPLRDDVALIIGTEEEISLWAGVLQSRAHPSVQIREVTPCPPGGSGALTVEGGSEQFCLWHSPLLDERDISTVEIAKMGQARPGLSVHLKTSSISKVRKSTAKVVGGKVGFIVNNRLMMVSDVTAPLGDPVTIYGNFSPDELHALVERINAGADSNY